MGKASRDKGKRWEREVAKLLRGLWGPQVRRGWQSREGGDEADITNADPWFWIEAKHHKRVGYRAALRQATDAAKDTGRRPVVMAKDDRQRPVVYMYLDDFLWFERLLIDCAGLGPKGEHE